MRECLRWCVGRQRGWARLAERVQCSRPLPPRLVARQCEAVVDGMVDGVVAGWWTSGQGSRVGADPTGVGGAQPLASMTIAAAGCYNPVTPARPGER